MARKVGVICVGQRHRCGWCSDPSMMGPPGSTIFPHSLFMAVVITVLNIESAGMLADVARAREWTTEIEPRLRDRGGVLRKPDIVFISEPRVIVSYTAVCSIQCRRTCSYNDDALNDVLRAKYPRRIINHLPFILAAREQQRAVRAPPAPTPSLQGLCTVRSHGWCYIPSLTLPAYLVHDQ